MGNKAFYGYLGAKKPIPRSVTLVTTHHRISRERLYPNFVTLIMDQKKINFQKNKNKI